MHREGKQLKSYEYINDFNIEGFQTDLISWFEREQRDLPWRKDQDPYKVWVSEIMLQQTRVDTVIPYFLSFVEQFPTIESLAIADEEKVLKAWEGLGYYSRVRNLQSAVQEVHEAYDGIVPNTADEISKLKGVGPYTTGAILSIAYGVPEPAVDGNVMRVLSRILSIWEDIAKPKTRKTFEDIIREIISKTNPSFFNQGLMELGAIVCTPTSPSCLLCPVREHCQAFLDGTQSELPVKTKKTSVKDIPIAVGILKTKDDKFLIHKRADTGLLAKLWEFPNVEVLKGLTLPTNQLQEFIFNEFQVEASIGAIVSTLQHAFSHLTWNMTVYAGVIEGDVKETERLKLVTIDELESYAFPVSHQKLWKEYRTSQPI
ncbi:A/G-specific adenine glycosylase [Bacillus salitolerans]|uniref:Adenine DNA glycosylase n=1 Tax=Bacillus salitolerans TaxID=1437434 RepID=A0ABW4LXV1_9BACI